MKIEIRLRELLKEKGMMQKDLVELTGLRPNTISNLCNNFTKSVYLDHIKKIAKALDISDVNEIIHIVNDE